MKFLGSPPQCFKHCTLLPHEGGIMDDLQHFIFDDVESKGWAADVRELPLGWKVVNSMLRIQTQSEMNSVRKSIEVFHFSLDAPSIHEAGGTAEWKCSGSLCLFNVLQLNMCSLRYHVSMAGTRQPRIIRSTARKVCLYHVFFVTSVSSFALFHLQTS